jgi:hypothetical protein
VSRTEIAIWCSPGEPVLRGVVLKRSSASGPVEVAWDSGRSEKVKARDPSVRFAYEGSARLEWLLRPGLVQTLFRENPLSVIVDVIRDEQGPITAATIKRRLMDLGIDPGAAADALKAAKPSLAADRHIVITGTKHEWSEVPVDPHAHLRSLPPREALDRLVAGVKLKPDEREALADAIKKALP